MTKAKIILINKYASNRERIILNASMDAYPYGLDYGIIQKLGICYNNTAVSAELYSTELIRQSRHIFPAHAKDYESDDYHNINYEYSIIFDIGRRQVYLTITDTEVGKIESRILTDFLNIEPTMTKIRVCHRPAMVDMKWNDSPCINCLVKPMCLKDVEWSGSLKNILKPCRQIDEYKKKMIPELKSKTPNWAKWMLKGITF